MGTKICSRCNLAKDSQVDFYVCQGKIRSECKKCTIKKNVKYQKGIQAWKYRSVDPDSQRTYMSEYYSKNKAKFAEYRQKFKDRYPEYHKDYARRRKNERH